MTQFLPPNLLALFAPRDPIQYLPPVDKLPHEKKTTGYSGLGSFLNEFEVSWFYFTFHFPAFLCCAFLLGNNGKLSMRYGYTGYGTTIWHSPENIVKIEI